MRAEYEALAQELQRQKAELLNELRETEDILHVLGAERESEWSEGARQEEQRHVLTH